MTEPEIFHEGVLRKSGRYPWGSGKNPHQRSMTFLSMLEDLRSQGLTDTEIAQQWEMSTTDLRATNSIAKNQKRAAQAAQAYKLKTEKQLSNVAIGEKMGLNESSVRALLDSAMQARADILMNTANFLKEQVAKLGFLDIGLGVEQHIGVSQVKLNHAVAMLKDEGYVVHKFSEETSPGRKINYKVLTPPGTKYPDVLNNKDKIGSVTGYTEDMGRTFLNIEPPTRVSSNRIEVRYASEGGKDMDGVIQIRRGVEDLSLGQARYAQVRIAVDKDRYLKGMAMYADDLPDGIDIRFNTNKEPKGSKLDAMKEMQRDQDGKIDEDNPFGSIIRQKHYVDSKGRTKLSPLNIVGSENEEGESTSGEEGGWSKWSSKLSSQFLSKQKPELATQQLELTYNIRKSDYDEIMSLTNPVVKRKLLETFADNADSSAKHLKAMGLPRTKTHVILPINSLKDDEVYAPWYADGSKVVLVRHPHGGKFEIPELRVNNKNREANKLIKNAADAIGINSKVAERLSGADFDGDTVLVIPNNDPSRRVSTESPLKGLEGFDPRASYPPYDGMRVLGGGIWDSAKGKAVFEEGKGPNSTKQTLMGDVSNLITDMTIKGASHAEIARAVRHSMVVIDAEKHGLNYKLSAQENGIAQLKRDYQGGTNAGAATLISRAKSQTDILDRRPRPASKGGPIDPVTGEKVWEYTGKGYKVTRVDKRTGQTVEKFVPKKLKSTKMDEARDAAELFSDNPQPIERIYGTHANRMKAIANEARKNALQIRPERMSSSARTTYKAQVDELRSKLNLAIENAPRERQAQLFASTVVKAKRQANPDLSDGELKKIRTMALAAGRRRMGAKKDRIEITPLEWEAIQAGAISPTLLAQILQHTDLDIVRQYALPRTATVMSNAKIARANNMLANGYTPAEIADALGVAPSTLSDALNR